MNIKSLILNRVQKAMISYGLSKDYNPQICKSNKLHLCDYQANGIISLAKKMNMVPLELSSLIVKNIKKKDLFEKVQVVYPGFINFTISKNWIANKINNINLLKKIVFVDKKKSKKIIIDYSSPNIAKEMHVGHLRSTVIGDAIARTLKFLGHNIIKINHLGDWGIQCGIIMAILDYNKKKKIKLSKLNKLYQKAKKKYDEDKEFANIANDYLIKLQSGEKNCTNIWKKIVHITIKENKKIYNNLNVSLTDQDIIAESFYKKMLPNIIDDLKNKKIAVEKDGATIVFLKNFKNKLGEPMGVIIRKRNGSYLYSTIDIASLKYRCEVLKADRILYFVDSRQKQYLMQILEISKQAGYIDNTTLFEHHSFGMILGQDGKPFKTRSGKSIKLCELIKEAIKRASCLIKKRNYYINKQKLSYLSNVIGVGAVKYFDLSKNRNTNYIFNWGNILNFEGNTSPYIQYAYTRILSIIKKSNIKINKNLNKFEFFIQTKEEKNLGLHLLQFEEILQLVSVECMPHILCNYLYDLACIFSNFYENCKILSSDKKIFLSRLKISYLTAKTLKIGLNILGIRTVKKM